MDGLPQVVESGQLPIVIPIRPYLRDHCFHGHAVLPAVEAMEALARAVRRFRPEADLALMSGVTFDKFLYLDPGAGHVSALGEISVHANGDVAAVLTTKTRSKHAAMARIKHHAALRLHKPVISYDLPAGGRRLDQTADGYVATVVAGEVIAENGVPTDARPGRLVRGRQPRPAARQ